MQTSTPQGKPKPPPPAYGFVTVSGILYAVRQARTAEEIEAVQRAEREDERARRRQRDNRGEIRKLTDSDIAQLMAGKIVEAARARAEVDVRDMLQAGIPEARIEANRDAAFARARRIEPRLDAMMVAP